MADSEIAYREVRLVQGAKETMVYVYCDAGDDDPLDAQGWHCKPFPLERTAEQIGASFADDPPHTWPLEAPPAAIEQ